MGKLLVASSILVWFLLIFIAAMRITRSPMPPFGLPWGPPLALGVVFTFAFLVFSVPREDGTAVLEQGLSASNVMTIMITMVAAGYLFGTICIRRRFVLLPLSAEYRPYTLMIAYNLLSSAWSVEPAYTLYRGLELTVFYGLTISIFDREDIRPKLGLILAIFVLVWLALVTPTIISSLFSGIVFSSAKNNTMPLVCATLLLWAVFEPEARHRKSMCALGAASFIIAGSASSTGALVWALLPAMLTASSHRGRRIAGLAVGTVIVAVFAFLVVGLSALPGLVDVLSTVLQKPPQELLRATGRSDFWPMFIDATRDHMFGSGFSAADRFVQLLVPFGSIPDNFSRGHIYIVNSHNMFLSAWAGTGVIGLCFAVAVLSSASYRAMKLDIGGRRFVLSVVFMLVLNGLTTPGIFQDWGPMNFAFVAVLAYTRVGVFKLSAPTLARWQRVHFQGAREGYDSVAAEGPAVE